MNLTSYGRRTGLVVVALACLTLSGCSRDVSQSGVETEIKRELTEQGSTVENVSCDGGLKGEVDATQKCTATVDGEETELLATVRKVDGKIVNFDIDFDTDEGDSDTPTDEPTDTPSDTPTDESSP